jgi:cytochrome c-type biogenesis protein CcmH
VRHAASLTAIQGTGHDVPIDEVSIVRKVVFACILGLVLLALFAGVTGTLPARAQSGPTPEQVNAVAKELWCPLCNGVRLDNCELQACVQMRDMISQKLAAGESKDQIKAYFVQQYGEVVMGTPKSPLPYILPPLIGVIAMGWVAYLVVIWVRRRPVQATTRPPATGVARQAGAPPAASPDEYMQRVDEELKNYD